MVDWLAHLSPGASGATAVLVAYAVDGLVGEPPARWHPVVWMGRMLSATGAPWPDVAPRGAVLRGAAAWLLGALATTAVAVLLSSAIFIAARRSVPWFAPLMAGALLGLLLKPMLAWRLLRDEVAAVERALSTNLDSGRERLQFLVSRNTRDLTDVEVRESAIESLAENLSDSFVAPLFWFVLGGLPAAALYRFANTADAMWGYRGRWEWAGKCSARADDILSYVPARVTALMLSIAAQRWPRGLRREAVKTPSPNSGWPMAMMALALDVRLSKPGIYLLNADGRPATTQDLQRGLLVAKHAAWLTLAAAVTVSCAAPLYSWYRSVS
jgi:adenosylcobinamide-phosphate synthase